jgi:hypothetical protein
MTDGSDVSDLEQEVESASRSVWGSLKSGLVRNLIIAGLAWVLFNSADYFALILGSVWAPVMRNMGLICGFGNAADILLRVLAPYIDTQALAKAAEKEPLPAAILASTRLFVFGMLIFTFAIAAKAAESESKMFMPTAHADNPNIVNAYHRDTWKGEESAIQIGTLLDRGYYLRTGGREEPSYAISVVKPIHSIVVTPQVEQRALNLYLQAQNRNEMRELDAASVELIQLISQVKPSSITEMPPGAKKYHGLLLQEMKTYWPAMKQVSYNAAQLEQETCTSLKSPACWTADAQLNVHSKNGVEKGRGFGQLTAVWRNDGNKRFDNLDAMHLKYPKELGNYGWDNWNDPQLSMRAYVLFMRDSCKSVPSSVTDPAERFKMCLSAYNGGTGGLNNDILSCKATRGCNPTKWDDNVELTSAKSRTRIPGYGQPAFDINRGYVSNITVVRRVRYTPLDKLMV